MIVVASAFDDCLYIFVYNFFNCSVQTMLSKKFILPLIAISAMSTSYVAASVIAHNDSSKETSMVNFRSAVSISYQSHNICSGIILNKRWIITSANCIQNHSNVTELNISYGSVDRNAVGRFNVGSEQIVVHPKFDSVSLVNNVALIKTKNDINFNDNVEPAKLPMSNTMEDERAYAIGWTNANEKVVLITFRYRYFMCSNSFPRNTHRTK